MRRDALIKFVQKNDSKMASGKEIFPSPARFAISKSKLEMSLDYIFGKGTSKRLDFSNIDFQYSRRTGRLRHVIDRNSKKILFTLRANGSIAPTTRGAEFMLSGTGKKSKLRWIVIVIDGVSDFIASGRSVFCRHVVFSHEDLRAGEDVVVLNEQGKLLAVGKSLVSASVMKQFKRGVAVKVREGIGV